MSAGALQALPSASRVTYKPGVRMVKFPSHPQVYAVEKGGVLRWIASEALAAQLYGPAWNKMIDDLPEVFHADYYFGQDIYRTEDFDVRNAGLSGTIINENRKE